MTLSLYCRKRSNPYDRRLSAFEEDFFDFSDTGVYLSVTDLFLKKKKCKQFFSKGCNTCSFNIITFFFFPGDHNLGFAGTYTSEGFRPHLKNVDTRMQVWHMEVFWTTRTGKCKTVIKMLIEICDHSGIFPGHNKTSRGWEHRPKMKATGRKILF